MEMEKTHLEFTENRVDPDNYKSGGVTVEVGATECLPELQESAEPESTKRNGRYNLRKSLAWDSAFFTSAGVLDPDELSGMITSVDKAEKHTLPGIDEDVSGSTESISTMHSDAFTLESLEDDLFVDIRASIQRSSKKPSTLTNSSSKTSFGDMENGAISALKKEDLSSRSKNRGPALKNTSGVQSVRMSRLQPKQNTGTPGSGKAPRQDSIPSQMKSTAKMGESNTTFPKPPKAISKAPISTASTKLDPVIVARAKLQCGSSKLGAVSTKGIQPRKVSTLNNAKTVLPKPTVLAKSAFVGSSSSSRVQSTRSSISSDSSGSFFSEAPAKSPLLAPRRNLVKSSKVGTAPSGSIAKTPSRAAMKNKPPSSKLSAHLMSTKLPSNISPASSISEWSSASSSSSLMINQSYNNSRTSLDVSSSRPMDSDIFLSNPNSPTTQGSALLGSNTKKTSTRTTTTQAPAKPSGLRMPSPKIGFFDGVKSSGRTPNGSPLSQSGLQSTLPKSGLQTRSINIKPKNSKVPAARTATALTNRKPDSPKALSPVSFKEKPQPSGNDTCISVNVNNSSFPIKPEGNATGENCLKRGEDQIEDGDKQVAHAGSNGNLINFDHKTDLNVCEATVVEDVKIAASLEGNNAGSNGNLSNLDHKTDLNVYEATVVEDKIVSLEGNSGSVSKYINQNGSEDLLVNQNVILEADYNKNGPGNYQAQGSEKHGGDIGSKNSGQISEVLRETLDCALPFPASSFESSPQRAPFALKNIFGNDECINVSIESAHQVAEKTTPPLPSSEQKENI